MSLKIRKNNLLKVKNRHFWCNTIEMEEEKKKYNENQRNPDRWTNTGLPDTSWDSSALRL